MDAEPLPSLREVIAQYGLQAKKSLGQHFLTDANLLAKIVRAAGDLSGATVIEIGPGPGGLTRAILDSNAQWLIAIEKDARCIAALQPLLSHHTGRFELIEQDALTISLRALGQPPRIIIANLPYNIGTQLVVDSLREAALHGPQVLQQFTVMLQKEVAERMIATPGSKAYGRLSVLMRQYTESAILFDVPPGAFSPPPKVTSSVLHAKLLNAAREDVPLTALEEVVAAAFNQRRKMLRQSLKAVSKDPVGLCEIAGVDATLRAEACDLAMFAALARVLQMESADGA